MKKYKNFININKLKYSIFDYDDNLLYLDTKIHFEHFINGKWVKEDISTEKFANIKKIYSESKFWDNDEWRCDFKTAFIEFRDFGPRGTNAHLDDTIVALNNKRYGPSWPDFIETLINGNLFGIVTTRGHEPDTLRKSIEYIIYNELNHTQQDEMLKNLMIYHKAFKKDFDYLIDDYLDNCIFIGVMSKSFVDIFKSDSSKNTSKAKSYAVNYIVKKFKQYKNKLNVPVTIGFSDDDSTYYNAIKKLFVSYNEPLDGVTYSVFNTSNGKKIKIH